MTSAETAPERQWSIPATLVNKLETILKTIPKLELLGRKK